MKIDCDNPLSVEILTDYWAPALSSQEEEQVELHLLSCDSCGDRLREIMAMGETIGAMTRDGELRVIVSKAFVERAEKEGLRVRQYTPPNGGSVECTVTLQDDMLIAHLAADLTGAKRIDLRYTDPGGVRRIQDIPFNPSLKETVFSVNLTQMRTMPKHVARIELLAVEGDVDQLVGEYTFNHTPSNE